LQRAAGLAATLTGESEAKKNPHPPKRAGETFWFLFFFDFLPEHFQRFSFCVAIEPLGVKVLTLTVSQECCDFPCPIYRLIY
jgi:hypothetical protein